MNRSLANVIFGGMGTGTKPVEGRRELCEVDTQLCHTVSGCLAVELRPRMHAPCDAICPLRMCCAGG